MINRYHEKLIILLLKDSSEGSSEGIAEGCRPFCDAHDDIHRKLSEYGLYLGNKRVEQIKEKLHPQPIFDAFKRAVESKNPEVFIKSLKDFVDTVCDQLSEIETEIEKMTQENVK